MLGRQRLGALPGPAQRRRREHSQHTAVLAMEGDDSRVLRAVEQAALDGETDLVGRAARLPTEQDLANTVMAITWAMGKTRDRALEAAGVKRLPQKVVQELPRNGAGLRVLCEDAGGWQAEAKRREAARREVSDRFDRATAEYRRLRWKAIKDGAEDGLQASEIARSQMELPVEWMKPPGSNGDPVNAAAETSTVFA